MQPTMDIELDADGTIRYLLQSAVVLPPGTHLVGIGTIRRSHFKDIGYMDNFRYVGHPDQLDPVTPRDLIKKPRKHTDVPFWCKK